MSQEDRLVQCLAASLRRGLRGLIILESTIRSGMERAWMRPRTFFSVGPERGPRPMAGVSAVPQCGNARTQQERLPVVFEEEQ